MKFTIVVTVFSPYDVFVRLLTGIFRQRYTDWELIVVLDGPVPEDQMEFHPRRYVWAMGNRWESEVMPDKVRFLTLPRAEGCWGNVSRHAAMDEATGHYICWVNHDNTVTPDFLMTHRENIKSKPGCISVVSTDHWKGAKYHGVFPRDTIAFRHIDLLCYAMPLEIAREIGAFGPEDQTIHNADWLTMERAMKLRPVVRSDTVVATHF